MSDEITNAAELMRNLGNLPAEETPGVEHEPAMFDMSDPTWPTEPGWYWFTQNVLGAKEGPTPAEIYEYSESTGELWMSLRGTCAPVDMIPGTWGERIYVPGENIIDRYRMALASMQQYRDEHFPRGAFVYHQPEDKPSWKNWGLVTIFDGQRADQVAIRFENENVWCKPAEEVHRVTDLTKIPQWLRRMKLRIYLPRTR